MLLVERRARLKWNGANKKRYVDLGYHCTKMGDEFLVEIEHLTKTTRAIILIQCDYCGNVVEDTYKEYNNLKSKTFNQKDTCRDQECVNKKTVESSLQIYGTESPNASPKVIKKKSETIQKNYGEEYTSPLQIPEVFDKMVNTTIDRYGSENIFSSEGFMNRFKGENHPCWNPNLTEEDREDNRKYPAYHSWRKTVLERDDYTCQYCNTRGCTLRVHHKDGYHWCEQRRLDIDNGVTLCNFCHDAEYEGSFHSIYGTRNNTENQWLDFIKKKTKASIDFDVAKQYKVFTDEI